MEALLEDPVNAQTDSNVALRRFDMNIAGSFLKRADQELAGQLDDALVGRHSRQAFRGGFGFLNEQML